MINRSSCSSEPSKIFDVTAKDQIDFFQGENWLMKSLLQPQTGSYAHGHPFVLLLASSAFLIKD